MSATQFRILAIVGGLLIVLALVLGQQKLEDGGRLCGSAFGASQDVGDCADLVSERRLIAMGVGVLGAAALAGGLYGIKRRENLAA